MKRIFLLLLAVSLALALPAQQVGDYCDSDYLVVQKEGSEQALRDYFDAIHLRSDTAYVAIYVPGFSPRLENPLQSFYSGLKSADPDAEVVLLSVNCREDVARNYGARRGYKADHYMCDTGSGYRSFLSFNTGYPSGTYFIKIDMASGRVICSGCFLHISPEFFDCLVSTVDAQPFGSFDDDGGSVEPFLPSDLAAVGLAYTSFEFHADSAFAIGRMMSLPALRGGLLAFCDDCNVAVQCFRCPSAGTMMAKAGEVFPDNDEKYRYIDIQAEFRDYFEQQGSFYWMPLSVSFLPDGNLGCVYDLPFVFEERKNAFAFFNQPAMLVRDASTLESKPMVELDDSFFDDNDEYYYDFTYFNVIDSANMMFGVSTNSWPFDGFEEYTGDPRHDSFMDEFYDNDNPTVQMVDVRTGKKTRRFGSLGDISRQTKTAYCFTEFCVGTGGGEVAYTDNAEGLVYVAGVETPWQVKRTYKAFELDPALRPAVDTTLFYTREYGNQFLPYFCRRIVSLRLTEADVHALIEVGYSPDGPFAEPVYEYRRIDRATGEVEAAWRMDKQHDGETLIAANLSSDAEPRLFYVSERGGRYYLTMVAEE